MEIGDLKKQVGGGFLRLGWFFAVFFGFVFSFFHKYESFPQPSNSWLLNTPLQLGNSSYLNKQTDGRAGRDLCGKEPQGARGAPGMLTPGRGAAEPRQRGCPGHTLPAPVSPQKGKRRVVPTWHCVSPGRLSCSQLGSRGPILPGPRYLPRPGAKATPRRAGADPVPFI